MATARARSSMTSTSTSWPRSASSSRTASVSRSASSRVEDGTLSPAETATSFTRRSPPPVPRRRRAGTRGWAHQASTRSHSSFRRHWCRARWPVCSPLRRHFASGILPSMTLGSRRTSTAVIRPAAASVAQRRTSTNCGPGLPSCRSRSRTSPAQRSAGNGNVAVWPTWSGSSTGNSADARAGMRGEGTSCGRPGARSSSTRWTPRGRWSTHCGTQDRARILRILRSLAVSERKPATATESRTGLCEPVERASMPAT